jgi:DNA-binding beta-propeller fold protein YncE
VFGTAGGLSIFSLNASTGSLTLVTGSPFQVRDDPAGVAVEASGKYAYVPNTADATISAFIVDSSTGALTPVSGSPFPSGGNGSINGPLGIAADTAGKFMYVCNASNDISAFSINGATGVLTPVGASPFPDGGNAPSAIIFVP